MTMDRRRRVFGVLPLGTRMIALDTMSVSGALPSKGGRTWDRLARISARLDPTDVFRRNINIPPTKEP